MVVVLPLVPDTTAIRLPARSLARASGSILSITLPRIEAPLPRRASREAAPASTPGQGCCSETCRQRSSVAVGAVGRVMVIEPPRRSSPIRFSSFFGPSYGVSDGTRTRDILDHNQGLYQLSYTHHARGPPGFAEPYCAA